MADDWSTLWRYLDAPPSALAPPEQPAPAPVSHAPEPHAHGLVAMSAVRMLARRDRETRSAGGLRRLRRLLGGRE